MLHSSLLSQYACHIEDSSFFIELELRLQEMADGRNYPIVARGNFNQVPENVLYWILPSCHSKWSVCDINGICADLQQVWYMETS